MVYRSWRGPGVLKKKYNSTTAVDSYNMKYQATELQMWAKITLFKLSISNRITLTTEIPFYTEPEKHVSCFGYQKKIRCQKQNFHRQISFISETEYIYILTDNAKSIPVKSYQMKSCRSHEMHDTLMASMHLWDLMFIPQIRFELRSKQKLNINKNDKGK